MGGCPNYGPFLNTAPSIWGTQKGTIVLTTTHTRVGLDIRVTVPTTLSTDSNSWTGRTCLRDPPYPQQAPKSPMGLRGLRNRGLLSTL